MPSARGIVTAVQEGRFLLVTDAGRTLRFVLSHRAAAEPQELPALQRRAARVRVDYSDGKHLIAGVAKRIVAEA